MIGNCIYLICNHLGSCRTVSQHIRQDTCTWRSHTCSDRFLHCYMDSCSHIHSRPLNNLSLKKKINSRCKFIIKDNTGTDHMHPLYAYIKPLNIAPYSHLPQMLHTLLCNRSTQKQLWVGWKYVCWPKPLFSPVYPDEQLQVNPVCAASGIQRPSFWHKLGWHGEIIVEQFGPVYGTAQVHWYPPMPSIHWPPFWQGFGVQSFWFVSQFTPRQISTFQSIIQKFSTINNIFSTHSRMIMQQMKKSDYYCTAAMKKSDY